MGSGWSRAGRGALAAAGCYCLCLSSCEKSEQCGNGPDQFSADSVHFRFSGLNFYQQVKLVNFIRRQVHQGRCYGCRARFPCRAALRAHMEAAGHAAQLPDTATWDQPE